MIPEPDSAPMSHGKQIDALYNDLDRVIERYRLEFDLPLASVVGTLEVLKQDIISRCGSGDGDDL